MKEKNTSKLIIAATYLTACFLQQGIHHQEVQAKLGLLPHELCPQNQFHCTKSKEYLMHNIFNYS